MSANIEAILVGLFSVAHTPDQAEHAAKEILRQHAHELAEKQRALNVTKLTKLTPKQQRWVRHGMDMAADKIDPEVSTQA